MRLREVGITKAQIEGLTEGSFSYNGDSNDFRTEIFFRQMPKELCNTVKITCGKSPDTAKVYHSNLIQQFNSAQIYNGDNVILIYSNANNLIAIGKPELNRWIDVEDNFKAKSFSDLNMIITNLTVY